ncbi:MAG: translocation/assembly module TamB domain-containing protein [Polyangiales bacterium]
MPQTAPDFHGLLNASLKLSGPIDTPIFEGNARVPNLTFRDYKPLDVRGEFQYEYGSLVTRLNVFDDEGELFDGEGSLLIDIANVFRDTKQSLATLETSPWRASLRIPPRKLDALPERVLKSLPEGLEDTIVAASLTVAGGAFHTRGDLQASLRWIGESKYDLCSRNTDPRAVISANLRDGRTTVDLDGLIETQRVVSMHAEAETPIDSWLAEASKPDLPSIGVHAEILNAPTESIPFLCRYVGGPLNAKLDISDLFGKAPIAKLDLQSNELRARRVEPAVNSNEVNTIVESPPAVVDFHASMENGNANADAKLNWWNEGSTALEFRVPIVWDGSHRSPQIADSGAINASGQFDQMPLQTAFAWMSGLVNVEGWLNGAVSARGTVQNPELSGTLSLTEGQIDVRSIGQKLRDVQGRLILDEDGLMLRGLKVRDGDGKAELEGELNLKGLSPQTTALRINASKFPVRQEGLVISTVDGRARLTGEFQPQNLLAKLIIERLEVNVPESSTSLQELADHPEVHLTNVEVEQTKPKNPYVIKVNVDADRPFIVKSDDQGFSATATSTLSITYDGEYMMVDGLAKLEGGYFEVLGKRFEIQSGSMIFNGDRELNPNVNLVAMHPLRGSNDTITVTASGKLSDPQISFRSTIPTESEAQVIALLITGSTRQERGTQASTEDASAAASSFLTGVAGGLIASSLRGELGKWAPTFALETGVTQNGEGSNTRFKLGFNFDALIPEALKGVIYGLYIEGQMTTRGDDAIDRSSTGQAQTPGVFIEIQWPKNLVTSGTMLQRNNWSVDVTWEP